MKHTNTEIHEFSIYSELVKNAVSLKALDIFEISNKEFYHRVIKILRLDVNDKIILFNSRFHIKCIIHKISKDGLELKIQKIFENRSLKPEIFWMLPLLKKEAFEDCLYTLTEMGAQEIQPIITRKSQQLAPYLESDRVKNIMITAAEQSKQFILPNVRNPETLDKIFKSLEETAKGSKIFFDPNGLNSSDIVENLKKEKSTKIICAIGPEGDLTETEKQLFKDNNFQFCKLTETVLRAKQAVVVATGILRSLL